MLLQRFSVIELACFPFTHSPHPRRDNYSRTHHFIKHSFPVLGVPVLIDANGTYRSIYNKLMSSRQNRVTLENIHFVSCVKIFEKSQVGDKSSG